MAVSVKTETNLKFDAPAPLFQTLAHEPITAEEFFTYDVSADGRRFLVNANAEQLEHHPVDIILSWASLLKH